MISGSTTASTETLASRSDSRSRDAFQREHWNSMLMNDCSDGASARGLSGSSRLARRAEPTSATRNRLGRSTRTRAASPTVRRQTIARAQLTHCVPGHLAEHLFGDGPAGEMAVDREDGQAVYDGAR